MKDIVAQAVEKDLEAQEQLLKEIVAEFLDKEVGEVVPEDAERFCMVSQFQQGPTNQWTLEFDGEPIGFIIRNMDSKAMSVTYSFHYLQPRQSIKREPVK